MTDARERRQVLDNGLRVVVRPLGTAGVVAVAVHYGVGFRSEPVGRGGFAHLFEHLMFQGSANVAAGDHFRIVQECGGSANGATLQDYTEFYQAVPAAALPTVLFLEADRMAGPRLRPATLRTQVKVVKEEIRQNVLGRAYGGFPWTRLPAALYTRFENSHNGYGDLADIDSAQLAEFGDFFRTFYVPGNAVVTICGDIEADRALQLAADHFGRVPAGPVRPALDLAEPAPTTRTRHAYEDLQARAGTTAIGYRLPDPAGDLTHYLAHHVLGQILTGHHGSRLRRRIVDSARLATNVSTSSGLFGPLRARDPDTFVLVASHMNGTTVEDVEHDIMAVLHDELAAVAAAGPSAAELASTTGLAAANAWQALDDLVGMTRAIGGYEILFGRPDMVAEVAATLARVTAADVGQAAAALAASIPAVLAVHPGATARPGPTPARRATPPPAQPARSVAAARDPVIPSGSPRVLAPSVGLPASDAAAAFGPDVLDTPLRSGVRLIASSLASTPMVEVRLAVRLTPASPDESATHEILAATLLRGTERHTRDELIQDLAVRGATLRVGRSARWLVLSASAPATDLPHVLAAIAEVLAGAQHRGPDVAAAVSLARQQAVLARHDPRSIAAATLLRELYGEVHELEIVPSDEALSRVAGPAVRDAHHTALVPARSTLVVVGDIDPDVVAAQADVAFAGWTGRDAAAPPLRTALAMPEPVTRWKTHAGAVQSRIRLVRPGLPRDESGYPALTLANIIFGGSFASRLTTTLRESRGLAYRCDATFGDHLDQVVIAIEVDTASDTTRETLDCLHSLLCEMADQPPDDAEIEAARRYAVGMATIGMSAQRSWAGNLLTAACLGQRPERIRAFPREIQRASAAEIRQLAKEFYEPDSYRGIVLAAPHIGATDSEAIAWQS